MNSKTYHFSRLQRLETKKLRDIAQGSHNGQTGRQIFDIGVVLIFSKL